jgi:hypothetical protein
MSAGGRRLGRAGGCERFLWDEFDHTRRLMLERFRALAESGADPGLLEAEAAGTGGVMRGLAALLRPEQEATSHEC